MADIRWKQRVQTYLRALATLTQDVELSRTRQLSDMERRGLLQGFEFTHELAWNLMKDYLEYEGFAGLVGSRSTTREAFRRGLFEEGEEWMKMIDDRNLTTHAYHEETANRIFTDIIEKFYPCFVTLAEKFTALAREEQK